jgi:branched-chain amino acid transport system permease protein
MKGQRLFRRELVNAKAVSIAILMLVLLIVPRLVGSVFYLHVLIMVFIFSIATCSLRLIAVSGQLSMGHAGMMCIGGYVSALLAKNLGLTPWLTIPVGGLTGLVVAYIIGFPFSRLRGIYFSMITLFFGMIVLTINQMFSKWTQGSGGLTSIPALLGGSKVQYYYVYLLLALVSIVIMYRLEFSGIGYIWKGVAQSYPVALSVGINEAHQRILAFAIGSGFASLAGGLLAHYSLVMSLDSFNLLASLNIIVYMLVGGMNSFTGPIIGTGILIFVPSVFRGLKEYVPFIFAGILLIVLFFMPDGLAGFSGQIRRGIKRLRKERVTTEEELTRDAA